MNLTLTKYQVPPTQVPPTCDDKIQTDTQDQEKELGTHQKQVPNDDSAETPVTEPVPGISSDLSQKLDDPPVTAGTSDVILESHSEDEVEDPLATDTVVPLALTVFASSLRAVRNPDPPGPANRSLSVVSNVSTSCTSSSR